MRRLWVILVILCKHSSRYLPRFVPRLAILQRVWIYHQSQCTYHHAFVDLKYGHSACHYANSCILHWTLRNCHTWVVVRHTLHVDVGIWTGGGGGERGIIQQIEKKKSRSRTLTRCISWILDWIGQ